MCCSATESPFSDIHGATLTVYSCLEIGMLMQITCLRILNSLQPCLPGGGRRSLPACQQVRARERCPPDLHHVFVYPVFLLACILHEFPPSPISEPVSAGVVTAATSVTCGVSTWYVCIL